MAHSLFPSNSRGPENRSELVAFNAGKCILSAAGPNGKFQVTADPRKGRISLERGADGLIHFRWTDRSSNRTEDDRIVFPDEIEFKKAKSGRDTDRVYLLKYKYGTQRFLFWMQDKSTEKDTENADKLNEYVNNPAAAAAAAAAASTPVSATAGQDQWMQMMGLQGLPAPPGAAAGQGQAAGAIPAANNTLGLDLTQLLAQFAPQTQAQRAAAAPSSSGLPAMNTFATPAPIQFRTSDAVNESVSEVTRSLFPATPAPPARPSSAGEADAAPTSLRDAISADGELHASVLANAELREALKAFIPEAAHEETPMRDLFRAEPMRGALRSVARALLDSQSAESVSDVLASLSLNSEVTAAQSAVPLSDADVRSILLVLEHFYA